jgi:ribosomal-protein-alanine N-acetyltransferase
MNRNGLAVGIRRMTEADLDRVMEIAASLQEAPHWPRAAYRAALEAEGEPRRIALVAVETVSGVVAGFAVVRVTAPEAELETIAVGEDFQRRGVARRLFSALADDLRQMSIKEILLEVRASNSRAQTLYRSLGFVETGRRPCYYTDPVEDAVLLSLPAL